MTEPTKNLPKMPKLLKRSKAEPIMGAPKMDDPKKKLAKSNIAGSTTNVPTDPEVVKTKVVKAIKPVSKIEKSEKTPIKIRRENGLALVEEARKGNLEGVIEMAKRGAITYLFDWVIKILYLRS